MTTTTSTSLAELKKNTSQTDKSEENAQIGFFNAASFNLTYRVSQMFAQSSLVPKHYQANPANCMIALNMANRLGADPLMVMQNLYVVHGTPAWSAQFLIATFNMCGRFSSLRYEWSGKKGTNDHGCTAWAIEISTGEIIKGSTITIEMAKKEGWYGKSGSKWQSMPDQMLMYRAASWFVRAYAPEIAMGLHTAEEMYDMRQTDSGTYELNGTAAINTAEIVGNAAEEQKIQEPGNTKPVKTKKDQPQAAENKRDNSAGSAQNNDISRVTLEAIETELIRLGAPNQLPPDLAETCGTGDPSELSEAEGKEVLSILKGM